MKRFLLLTLSLSASMAFSQSALHKQSAERAESEGPTKVESTRDQLFSDLTKGGFSANPEGLYENIARLGFEVSEERLPLQVAGYRNALYCPRNFKEMMRAEMKANDMADEAALRAENRALETLLMVDPHFQDFAREVHGIGDVSLNSAANSYLVGNALKDYVGDDASGVKDEKIKKAYVMLLSKQAKLEALKNKLLQRECFSLYIVTHDSKETAIKYVPLLGKPSVYLPEVLKDGVSELAKKHLGKDPVEISGFRDDGTLHTVFVTDLKSEAQARGNSVQDNLSYNQLLSSKLPAHPLLGPLPGKVWTE